MLVLHLFHFLNMAESHRFFFHFDILKLLNCILIVSRLEMPKLVQIISTIFHGLIIRELPIDIITRVGIDLIRIDKDKIIVKSKSNSV